MRRERGQAVVELVVLAPLLVLLCAALAQTLIAAGVAADAEHAAARGAAASAVGSDPRAAALRVLPRRLRAAATARIENGFLVVSVDPPGPLPAVTARSPLIEEPSR